MTYKVIGTEVFDGTMGCLKNLEKLGIIRIKHIDKFDELNLYDDVECLEYWREDIEMVIVTDPDHKVDKTGRDLVADMIQGLDLKLECLWNEL